MSHLLTHPVGEGWLAVGSAAMATDPLASNGIAGGLKNGLNAAGVIHDYLRGKQTSLSEYSNTLKQIFDRYLADRLHYYSSETRWPQSVFWQRRQKCH